MGTYFKAVRMDGFDFYSQTVDYASICGTGEYLPELPGGPCCTGLVYHASVEAVGTLIGGSWPCRLFLVEGTPVSEEDTKRGFATLRVMQELPAWQALGPQGEAVAALIERTRQLTKDEAQRLSEAFRQGVVLGAGRGAVRDAVRGAVWDAARDTAWDAVQYAVRYAVRDADWAAVRGAVWGAVRGAVWDAALALVMQDLISERDFSILYGLWQSVIG